MNFPSSASDISLNGEFPDLSDESVSELVSSINRVGYGVVSGYLEQRELDQLRTFVEDSVRDVSNQYVCFTGCADLPGTPLERMAKSQYSDGFAPASMNARQEIRLPIS